MGKLNKPKISPAELRQRAEKLHQERGAEVQPLTPEEIRSLVHELEVHQIELEMQNDELRESQRLLEESRDRYADLYDFSPVGYVTLDPVGRIKEINLTAANLLGVERGRLVDQLLANYIVQDHRKLLHGHLRKCSQGSKAVITDIVLETKEHRLLAVELHSVQPGDTASGEPLYRTSMHDVTESRRLEKALRDSEAQLRCMFESSPLGMFMWQLVADDRLILAAANPAASQILGVNTSKYIGLEVEEIFPSLAQTDLPQICRQVAAQGASWHTDEFIYDHEDIAGIFELHLVQAAPGKMMGIFSDVTQRKESEREVTRLAKFPSENPNPVLRATGDGTILYANDAAQPVLDEWNCRQGQKLPEQQRNLLTNSLETGLNAQAEIACNGQDFLLTFAPVLETNYVNIYGLDVTGLHRAERELRAREADQALILRSAPMVLYSTEAGGEFGTTWTSGRVEEITGIEAYRFIEEPDLWSQRIHPEDRERAINTFRGILQTRTFSVEYRWQHKDGSWLWFLDQAALVFDEKGEPKEIIGTWLDITKRKRAEETLQRERDFTAAILGTAGALVIVLDPEGRIVRFNAACERTTGYSFDEVRGRPLWELFLAPEESESVRAIFEDIRAGQFPNEHENYWLAKDGSRRRVSWSNTAILDGNGKVEYVIGTGIDATERMRAQQALQEAKEGLEIRVRDRTAELARTVDQLQGEIKDRIQAEENLQQERGRLYSVLQMLPGFVILRDRDYRIRFANDKFLELFNEPGDQPCHTLLHNRDEPCEACPALLVLQMQTSNRWEELTPDGRAFEIWGYPFSDADGTRLVLELGIEITDRKRLESEVLKIAEDERQRFGRDLHDGLGQTLSGISCLSEVLHARLAAKSLPEADDAKRIESLVIDSIKLARSLVRGLNPVAPEPEGLMDGLKELASNMENIFGIKCVCHCPRPVLVEDSFAAAHLYRIAQEAAHNAVRHGKAQQIIINLSRFESGIALSIEDNGSGIPEDLTQTTGVGINIMKYRASAIGARFSIRRRQGGGTSVACLLTQSPSPEEST